MAKEPTTRSIEKSVLLLGDTIDDRYLLPRTNHGHKKVDEEAIDEDWKNHRQWVEYRDRGGVEMLARMLESHEEADTEETGFEATKNKEKDCKRPVVRINVCQIVSPKVRLQSMALLASCELKDGIPKKFEPVDTGDKLEKLRLRVCQDLGYREADVPLEICEPKGLERKEFKPPAEPLSFDVIGISDAGNDLRNDEDLCSFLQDTISHTDKPVVLKTHLPLADGSAWETFTAATNKRRVVIVHSDDLRDKGPTIRRGVPWDRVVEDLKLGLTHELLEELLVPDIDLIVLFGVEAAAVLRASPDAKYTLSFICDPACAEGQVEATLPGAMVGYMNSFMAALVSEIAVDPEGALPEQVKESLLTMRAFAQTYWRHDMETGELNLFSLPKLRADLDAWVKRNGKKQNTPRYIVIDPHPTDDVSLLRDIIQAQAAETTGDWSQRCFEIATSIVRNGARAEVSKLPHAEFGKLLTLDAAEIEALRGIARLIEDYNSDQARAKPISFAVFGPPGAGKSFGVRQLVDEEINPVEEFNLSQATERDLPLFFQKIRDQNLKGKTPLCFFDEFDSGNRQLLKFFLAPMQDGEYREGDAIRPIGRGIFVFAGGTASTFEEFAGRGTMKPKKRKKFDKEASASKSPDFVSRLSGYLNVTGIKSEQNGALEFETAEDIIHLLHRAILIRSVLERHLPDLVPINATAALSDDLIRWLLINWEPAHGARSVETLIRGIAANRRTTKIGLSDLPMDILANVHTDHCSSRADRKN